MSTVGTQIVSIGNTYPRTKTVTLGMHTIEVYSIGFLARATELAKVTLRLWERQKILPKPLLRLPGGMRYYTAMEIVTFSGLIAEHYASGRDLRKLKNFLHAASLNIREKYNALDKTDNCPIHMARLLTAPKPKAIIFR